MMNDIGGLFVFFWIIAIPVIIVMLVVWSSQKKKLGNVRCRRCNHVGPAKGLWVPFRGMKAVCAKCQGDDWVKVQAEDQPPAREKAVRPSAVPQVREREKVPAKTGTSGPKSWYYKLMGTELGPLSQSELTQLACEGTISIDTDVRKGKEGVWVPASTLKWLFDETGHAVVPQTETSPAEQAPANLRLRPCPDCGKMVSKRAPQCPSCGCPLSDSV